MLVYPVLTVCVWKSKRRRRERWPAVNLGVKRLLKLLGQTGRSRQLSGSKVSLGILRLSDHVWLRYAGTTTEAA